MIRVFTILFLMTLSVLAVDVELGDIEITSNRSVFDRQKSIVTFTGNVEVDDGESKLFCKLMDVYLNKENSPEKINCFDDVEIRKETSVATADRARYMVNEQIVTLIGNVKIITVDESGAKKIIRGTKVIYNLKTNIIEVKNSKMNKGK